MAKKQCSTCLGLGIIPVVQPPMPCPECDGRGYVEDQDEDEMSPCLCGHSDTQIYHTVLNGWQVHCPYCGAETDGDVDRNEAIRWWNHINSKD